MGEVANHLIPKFQEIEEDRLSKLVCADVDGISNILAESLGYGHSTGTLDDKERLLARVRSGQVTYTKITTKIDKVTLLGPDVALATGMLHTSHLVRGEQSDIEGRYLTVWRDTGDGWKLEALQSSAIRP